MTKKELRTLYRTKRLELLPKEREDRSELICQNLFRHFNLKDKMVSLYLPIEHFHEINTYKILELGQSLDVQFAIPKVEAGSNKLSHFTFDSIGQLELSEWGIPEPKSGKKVQIKDLQFVIIPLLAYDEKGFRVGYGKGFYDVLLKKCSDRCQFIGLSYFDEPAIIDDLHQSDIPLHYCVTPNMVHRFI